MNSYYDPDSLTSVSSLPPPFQPVFPFRYFNAVQSESFSEIFLSDMNMVIAAPTGSGKTGLFELSILRLLSRHLTADGQFHHVRGALKTVYIAPTKALVQEKCRDWREKFGQSLGAVCQELTSDSDTTNFKEMQETDVILSTPEKFDSTTRRGRDHGELGFFGDIALLLIDEVHLLNESRGAALEAIVSRMKMLARCPEMKGCPLSNIRYIAVSATIPNIENIAEWLRVPHQGIKRFGEEMRPVKLSTRVFGYSPAKNDFLFERRLQNYLFDVIFQHAHGKPALIFCSTRKGAQDAALTLADTVSKPGVRNLYMKSEEQNSRLQLAALGTTNKNMQKCLRCGVGFHNGGLDLADRGLVEGLFLSGDLQVLCTTNTLSVGVNLPAHLVVIKSTQYFNKEKGRYLEYERSTLLQMCGRAGRPQFDDSGTVVLMTRKETVHLYENILAGSEPVESELLPAIVEHLNAEITMMTVFDVSIAIDWLKCSYLYVRIKKNPHHYHIQKGVSEDQLDKHIKEICLRNVYELVRYGMVLTDEFGFTLKPLEPGRLMAKYYLKFETMKAICQIPERSTMEDLLRALAQAGEFSWIKLRRHEKRVLNEINQDTTSRIRFPVLGINGKAKKRIQTDSEKICVLVNDAMSGEPTTLDFTMTQDLNGIFTNGTRIARCMSEYFIFKRRFKETKYALILAKCLRQRLWEDSPLQLKQLPGIGMVTAKTLQKAGIDTFEKLATADPRRLETITGRKYPFGNQVKDTLDALPPKVDLIVLETGAHVTGKYEYCLELTRISLPKVSQKWHAADLVVGNECENQLVLHERIRLDQFSSPYQTKVYSTSNISAALVCEHFVGVDLLNNLVNSKSKLTGHEAASYLPEANIQWTAPSETRYLTDTKIVKERSNLPSSTISGIVPKKEFEVRGPLYSPDILLIPEPEALIESKEYFDGTLVQKSPSNPGNNTSISVEEDKQADWCEVIYKSSNLCASILKHSRENISSKKQKNCDDQVTGNEYCSSGNGQKIQNNVDSHGWRSQLLGESNQARYAMLDGLGDCTRAPATTVQQSYPASVTAAYPQVDSRRTFTADPASESPQIAKIAENNGFDHFWQEYNHSPCSSLKNILLNPAEIDENEHVIKDAMKFSSKRKPDSFPGSEINSEDRPEKVYSDHAMPSFELLPKISHSKSNFAGLRNYEATEIDKRVFAKKTSQLNHFFTVGKPEVDPNPVQAENHARVSSITEGTGNLASMAWKQSLTCPVEPNVINSQSIFSFLYT